MKNMNNKYNSRINNAWTIQNQDLKAWVSTETKKNMHNSLEWKPKGTWKVFINQSKKDHNQNAPDQQ